MNVNLLLIESSGRLQKWFERFKSSQIGAVSVDFVVVTAAVAGLGVATVAEVSDRLGSKSDDVSSKMEAVIDSTQYEDFDDLETSSTGGGGDATTTGTSQNDTSSIDAILEARQALLDARAALKEAKAALKTAREARNAASNALKEARSAYKQADVQDKSEARAALDAARDSLQSARGTLKSRRNDVTLARATLKEKRKIYKSLKNG